MTVLLAGLVVAAGALVQGAVGYGMALVAAPLLLLVEPALVPVPVLLLVSAQSVLAVAREVRDADWRGVGWAVVGRVPGTALGVLAVVALPERGFAVAIALAVLACVGLSLLSWRPRPTRRALVVAGLASGTTGTAASIGGPPIALLYQDADGPRVRATLGAYFLLGSVLSIGALAAAGQVTGEAVRRAAVLAPFLVAGFALSSPLRRVLDRGWTRPAVLGVAAASAVALLVTSLVSA